MSTRRQKSLKAKVIQMNLASWKILDAKLPMSETEEEEIYAIADGLTANMIDRLITGRCSLQNILDWPVTRIEDLINSKLNLCNQILKRGGIKYMQTIEEYIENLKSKSKKSCQEYFAKDSKGTRSRYDYYQGKVIATNEILMILNRPDLEIHFSEYQP